MIFYFNNQPITGKDICLKSNIVTENEYDNMIFSDKLSLFFYAMVFLRNQGNIIELKYE